MVNSTLPCCEICETETREGLYRGPDAEFFCDDCWANRPAGFSVLRVAFHGSDGWAFGAAHMVAGFLNMSMDLTRKDPRYAAAVCVRDGAVWLEPCEGADEELLGGVLDRAVEAFRQVRGLGR